MAVLFAAAAVSGATVPVLAQQSATRHARHIQANNYRFCAASASGCSTTADTNHKTRVHVGQKVKWVYKDTECDTQYLCPGHNVTFAHRHSPGTTHTEDAVIYTTVFHHTGTYKYWCTHHKAQGMTGRLVVVK